MLKQLIAALALLSLGSSALLAVDDEPQVPGKPVSKEALRQIYAGKTWFWSDGAAYFRPDGKFYAYSGKGSPQNYVEGGWSAYRNGKICFSGTWHSASGSGFDSSCFNHVAEANTVHQQRNPFSTWYVFKNAKQQKNDEYRKLVRGDYATSNVKAAKNNIGKAAKG